MKVEVIMKDETVWLAQKALADLFSVKVPTIKWFSIENRKTFWGKFMSELDKVGASSVIDATAGYLKEGGGYDVAIAAMFLTHGVPLPPSIVKRFRQGVGRLIDGSFDLLAGTLERAKARANFEANLQQKLVEVMAKAGAKDLAQTSPNISNTVALSMLNEYGLKFENKAAIARQAFEILVNESPTKDDLPDTNIDVDWLNYFSDIAAQKSGSEMQSLMGKILAGEIRKPGSFSPLTISVLSTLTPAVAQKFLLLCSVSVEMDDTSFIHTGIFPDFLHMGISELEFSYIDLLTLRSHQLLASETGSSFSLTAGEVVQMSNCGKPFQVIATGSNGEKQEVSVALFSQIGNEMRRLLSPQPVPWFEDKLSKIFNQPNLQMQFVVA